MKYRVKDPKKRELVKELFGVDFVRSNFTDTELRADLSFAGRYLAVNRLPVEQVQELAEGWNPYPETKPEKADELYLVAYKGNDGHEHIDTRWFNGKVFDFWISDIFAWREMLEIWKETDK